MLENTMSTSHQKLYRFFLAIAPGLEDVLLSEVLSFLPQTDSTKIHKEQGGLSFRCSLISGIELLQKLRTPTKMLMRISTKKTTSISDISTLMNNAGLQDLLHPQTPCHVTVHVYKSKLFRRDIVEQKANRVLTGILGTGSTQHSCVQKLQIRIDHDLATLSIQVHSGHLYQRGWRIHQQKASLRENLASVLLRIIDWQPSETLLDPFCGAGTIPIEAARIYSQFSTRMEQEENWHFWKPFDHQPKTDSNSTKISGTKISGTKISKCDHIFASDKDAASIDSCKKNSIVAQVEFPTICRDINDLIPPTTQGGVIACNPPYGLRLGQNVDSVYRCLGNRWREHFVSNNWRLVFLCPNMRLAKLVDANVISHHTFSQGGLQVHICTLL